MTQMLELANKGFEATITAMFMKEKKHLQWMRKWKVLIRDDFLKTKTMLKSNWINRSENKIFEII